MKKAKIEITAGVDLYEAVVRLPVNEVREIVQKLSTIWFMEKDGTLNPDKEIGADQIQDVTTLLNTFGIYPTR